MRKATVVATSACECFVLDRSAFNKILGSLKDILNRDVEERKKGIDGAASGGEVCNVKFNDLNTLAVLGSGTFGKVTLVQHKTTKQVCIIACISIYL